MVKILSLFSGAGGLDIGAKQAGAEHIVCIEKDDAAMCTLEMNHNFFSCDLLHADICTVNFKKWHGMKNMILVGGPPCQPFSKNGYWIKNVNRLIQNDPRNMVGQYLRALAEASPKGFLFENVESLLHPTNRSVFNGFMESAEALGYACSAYKVNAADFGVPQKRKRIFVFGRKNAKTPMPGPVPTHRSREDAGNIFNRDLPFHTGVKPFIGKFSDSKYAEPQEDASRGTYYYELCHVPSGNNYIALASLKNYKGKIFIPGKRFWNFLYKLHPDEPSITIAAQPGPWVGPFHWNNRRLRVPEIAAIQTFPGDYHFFGNRREVQQQIGNAVPCVLAERMTRHLLEYIA